MLDDEHPTELIVDRRQRDLVATVLTRDLEVWPAQEQEESADLDLVLLRNLRLDAYEPLARERYAKELAALERLGGKLSALDVLLYDLRTRFAADLGTVPLMGKNRDAIVGFPQHKGFVEPELPKAGFVVFGDRGTGIRIGVVDGPLAPHELLPPDVVAREEEFVADGPAPIYAGHATFVAGVIRQTAPGAHLDVRRGLDPDDGTSSAWTVAKQIASFQHADIHILNLSLGCVTTDDEPPLVLRRALDKLGPGILVVAAAGNRADPKHPEMETKPVWPAASTRVVAVGAKESGVGKADFSPEADWVNCFAPGVDITSTYLTGPVEGTFQEFPGLATWKGTSFAAAMATARIAVRMSADRVPGEVAFQRVLADDTSRVSLHPKE